MRRIILIALFIVVLSVSTAFADAFQFIRDSTGALAVEATVSHNGRLIGYSNDQGIIFINFPQGSNIFTITYMGQTTQVQLTVSGNPQVQVIYIQ